ncbi:hypothetical protein WKI68_36920 [Streptomyces sp. MS1.HAVA.3]|uniref:Tape measure protein n=1 Tax=Streptomyces caledonius TaxID=3134107 RepID=A0ABU8UBL5_9ACTN
MAERMAFTLDGNDNLSPVFRRIGESADRFHQRINEAVEESGGELRAFTRGANGQLQELDRTMQGAGRSATTLGNNAGDATTDVRTLGDAAANASAQVERLTRDSNGRLRGAGGRFVSAGEAAQRFGIDVGAAVPNVTRLGNAAGDAAVQVGGKSGGLGGALGAVAAVAGLSALPALGALVPALAGAGLAAVTLKLGFSGIGAAMEAAGKGKKEYAEALKALPAPAREFTKQLVSTKKEFAGLSGEIQKAMLPGFTEALKESSPLIKIVGSAATEMGKGFGDAAAGVGRLMKDSGFQRDFTRVLGLGNVFVKDLTRGLGGLTRGFIDFGAKSEPTLRSLSGGLSDLLGKGLPGMFQGLERGIGGSSKFLDGFFSMLNTLLPAIGRFSGEVARTFGPLLGEQMTLFGRVASRALDLLGHGIRLLKPVMDDLVFGLKAAWIVGQQFGSAFKEAGKAVIDALAPAGSSIENVKGPLQRLHDMVQANRIGLMEFARIGAGVMLTIAEGVIRYLPDAIGAFRMLSMGALSSLDVIISGLAMTIGKIPGFGEQFVKANRDFDKFRDGFLGGLQTAEDKTRSFANAVLPRLSQNRLKMDITSWESQIKLADQQINSLPPGKTAELKAVKAQLEAKVAQAKRDLASIDDETVYINVVTRSTPLNNRTMIMEGLARAGGGIVRGPGTSTSDSIPAMLSDGEYVLQASAVDRLGLSALDALNEGRTLPAAAAAAAAMPAARAPEPT